MATEKIDKEQSKTEKKQQREQRRAEKKAENEKLYQEVMEQDSDETPKELEEPKKKNKWVKRVGIVLFVLLNAAVIYFTAASEFSKKAPEPIKFDFTNILYFRNRYSSCIGRISCMYWRQENDVRLADE